MVLGGWLFAASFVVGMVIHRVVLEGDAPTDTPTGDEAMDAARLLRDSVARAEAAYRLSLDTVTPHPDFHEPARPELTTVLIRPDTVWFLGAESSFGAPQPTYGYVRATGAWLRRGPRPDLERGVPAQDAHWPRAPFEVAPGVRVGFRESRGTAFRMLMTDDGATHPLPTRIPLPLKRRLVEAIYTYRKPDDRTVAEFPVESTVSAWVVQDSTLWLGRAGNWSEGWGGLGGLVRYDLRSGEIEGLWSEHLASATVSGLAWAGGRLWIGTLHPGEYGPWGHTGVLLHDPEGGGWERLTPETSPLPSALVWGLAGVGDSVWIATDRGLAAVDARIGAWDARFFRPALAGDTLVVELQPTRPTDPVVKVAWRLMSMLEVERRAAFMAAVERASVEPFVQVYRSNEGWERPLAQPVFVPFLMRAVERGGPGARLAVAALGLLPPSEWNPTSVFMMMSDTPIDQAAAAAAALAQAGYRETLAWLRLTLADSAVKGDKSGIVRSLGELRDTASIPLLARLSMGGREGYPAYRALTAMRSDTAWMTIARVGLDAPALRGSIVTDVEVDSLEAPLDDPRFLEPMNEIARLAMAEGDRWGRLDAAEFLLRYGDASAVGEAVQVLLEQLKSHAAAAWVFVRVTGVESAPFDEWGSDDPAERARSIDFWTRWWAENAAGFHAVPEDQGSAAVQRWRHAESG